MNIIAWMILGALVGWISDLMQHKDVHNSLSMAMLIGVAGACVGGWIFAILGYSSIMTLHAAGLLASLVTAAVFVYLFRYVEHMDVKV